ncbi:MAG: hypothetical protein KJ676_03980 [Alphaproteobacteria bacterium]|nr:hypothetical protein [Alphaproteobacteria bacterium]MBU1526411.1 hypothetical protein [Alphaproteobacteria bacterium]MBU2118601.1 hypothetical protein [Alphaproteobacteria bacterium]MBU2352268.1 hypothetical protein [Alphaproteobacteria bacterium]MBU2383624.1 hypothetical protein [Alphaproteobacteria bacterium]
MAKQRSEAEAREHDAEDLEAQERAASAAEEQIWPAWAAAVLTLIGTGLLVWNLCEARRATALAREHMSTDLRAWVLPLSPAFDSSSNTTVDGGIVYANATLLAVAFQNVGRSPALGATMWVEMRITEIADPPQSVTPPTAQSGASAIVGPNQPCQTGWTAIGDAKRDAFFAGHLAVYLYAGVAYRTIFDGPPCLTEVCYRIVCNGVRRAEDGSLQPNYEIGLAGIQLAT